MDSSPSKLILARPRCASWTTGHNGCPKVRRMTSGAQDFGMLNNDGCHILDCVEAHDLAVANTFKRPNHLATYTSSGRSTQINYWMVWRRDLKLATNIKVIPPDKVTPQYCLSLLDVQIDQLRWVKKQNRVQKNRMEEDEQAQGQTGSGTQKFCSAPQPAGVVVAVTTGNMDPGKKYNGHKSTYPC